MRHDSRAIANYLIRKADSAGKAITAMQVINLVYFAHGWSLGLYEAPLIDDEVEAWDYGPIIRPVYDAFKRFGNQPITELAMERHFLETDLPDRVIDTTLDPRETALVDKVWHVYGTLKGFQLSEIAHRSDSPWQAIYQKHGRNAVIPDELIGSYFKKLAEQNTSKRAERAAASG